MKIRCIGIGTGGCRGWRLYEDIMYRRRNRGGGHGFGVYMMILCIGVGTGGAGVGVYMKILCIGVGTGGGAGVYIKIQCIGVGTGGGQGLAFI